MHDDIVYHVLKFARNNGGMFKKSSFKYIADPPRTWWEAHKVLDQCVARGYFEKTRSEGKRVYVYYLTQKGYEILELWGI